MSRIPYPANVEAAPAAAQPALKAVQQLLGKVPNLFRVISNSPAALQGYVGLHGALSHGELPAQTRERLAIAIAELNGCEYCLSAHTFYGRLAKLNDAEITANRNGASNDPFADAAVRFAVRVARARGQVSNNDVAEVREAGYSTAQIIEIIAHVALATMTNLVNNVTQTEIDFPHVNVRQAA